MKLLAGLILVFVGLAVTGGSALNAAERTQATAGIQATRATQASLSGQISDSLCGAKHEAAAEGEDKLPDRDCTLACVKGGSKYVLVSDGKIYTIANQDFADLPARAGRAVKVTGELNGDAITITGISGQ
jgi:hypothetical protein